MSIKEVTLDLSVSPQIDADDVKEIAQLGFKSIVCNRPDNEAPLLPNYTEIEKAAGGFNIQFSYLPVVPSQITESDGIAMSELLKDQPKPVLAYCRSGTRSTILWAIGAVKNEGQDPEEVIQLALDAGYDIHDALAKFL